MPNVKMRCLAPAFAKQIRGQPGASCSKKTWLLTHMHIMSRPDEQDCFVMRRSFKQTGHGRLSLSGCKDCASAAASSTLPAFWRHLTTAGWRVSSSKAAATASKETRQLAFVVSSISVVVQCLPKEHKARRCACASRHVSSFDKQLYAAFRHSQGSWLLRSMRPADVLMPPHAANCSDGPEAGGRCQHPTCSLRVPPSLAVPPAGWSTLGPQR